MKRADAQKAVDVAFAENIAAEYRNILMLDLSADHPDRSAADTQFRKALAINVSAHAMASRAIAESKDLEDEP